MYQLLLQAATIKKCLYDLGLILRPKFEENQNIATNIQIQFRVRFVA